MQVCTFHLYFYISRAMPFPYIYKPPVFLLFLAKMKLATVFFFVSLFVLAAAKHIYLPLEGYRLFETENNLRTTRLRVNMFDYGVPTGSLYEMSATEGVNTNDIPTPRRVRQDIEPVITTIRTIKEPVETDTT